MFGGAEKSTQILAEELINKNMKTVVVCIHPYKDKTEFYNGVKIYYLNHRNIYFKFKKRNFADQLLKPLNFLIDTYNPFIGEAIKEILKTERPDIIHTNNIYGISPVIWKIAKDFHLPVVHTLRDLQLLCAGGTMFKKHTLCQRQCLECKILTSTRKYFSKNIDYVVGISNFILNEHLEYGLFNNTKKAVIFNPLLSEPISLPKTEVHSPVKFLYLGGVFEHKGFYFLIKAFSKLGHIKNKWELLIAGRGEYNEKNHPENIKFLGFTQVKKIYPDADVLIVPSIWNEPFGRIIVEANSYGLPVIGSNRGGIPELILHGKTGFIFNPNNEDDFLNYVKLFIENPDMVLKLSPNCLEYSHRFTKDRIADMYIQTYYSLVNKKCLN
ncbi:MAG TPA: glycosyltransferase family 4 protein [bacterium]|nr:glycosyltransferase family 4 protein [bacterium]